MGLAATLVPKGLGPQNPTKMLAHAGVLLGHLLFQNRIPKLSDPGPPLTGAVIRNKQNAKMAMLQVRSLVQ